MLCLVPAAVGETRRAGQLLFDAAPGFGLDHLERGPEDLPVSVYRHDDWTDDEAPDVSLWITRSVPAAEVPAGEAGLRTWTRDFVQRHLDDDDGTIRVDRWMGGSDTLGGQAVDLQIGSGRTVDEDGDERQHVAVAALRAGPRVTAFYVLERDPEDVLESVQALQSLLPSLRFAPESGPDPLLGQPVPGDFDGYFWGTRLDLVPQIDGSLSNHLRTVDYLFRADGTFYDGMPPGGIRAFDYDELAMSRTGDVGQYVRAGDELILRYADGDTDTVDVTDAGGLRDRGAIMFPAKLLKDGTRFSGTRSTISYTPTAAGFGSSGGVSSSSTMEFRPDGTFGREGFVAASGTFDNGGGYATNTGKLASQGRYEYAGGELRLTYDDGRVWAWTCLALTNKDGDVTLWAGGQPMGDVVLPPGAVLDEVASATPAANPLDAGASNPLDTPANPLDR